MPDLDQTALLKALLRNERESLKHLLDQRSYFDAGLVPTHVARGISDARSEIDHLKTELRRLGESVDDWLTDTEEARGLYREVNGSSLSIDTSRQLVLVDIGQAGTYNIQHFYSSQRSFEMIQAEQRLAGLPIDYVPEPTSLPSGSYMPHNPNPLFVGREMELMQVAKALKRGTTSAIVAATGMGGIGKTQLASEFVHRYGCYFAGGVFWMSFAEADGIEIEIAACGLALDIPHFGELDFPAQVARVRQLWQEDIPRLLIFDNCEDEDLLRKYRPTSGGSRVLLTSRRYIWDSSIGLYEQRLDQLPREQSIALLRRFRPDLPVNNFELDALAAALGDLPLALQVAGNYLKRYQSVISPAQYLDKLRSAPLQGFALRALKTTPTGHELDLGHTLFVSYERLEPYESIDSLALALLAHAAFFAPGEPIPHDLVFQCLASLLPEEEPQLAFEDALIRLEELGLIEVKAGEYIRIHRLIIAFVLQINTNLAFQSVVEQNIIKQSYHIIRKGYPNAIQPLLAHLRYAQQASEYRDDVIAGTLANALARVENMLTNYSVAKPLYERALIIREKVFGPDHPKTANVMNNLAVLLLKLGDYSSAKPLFERVFAIRKKEFGLFDSRTAHTLNNIASLLKKQGDYDSAKLFYERALAIREQKLGSHSLLTARTLVNLANLFYSQAEYEAAKPLYERALAIREQRLEPDHPHIASSLVGLATLLHDQGEYQAALPLYKRALAIREQQLGSEHIDTLTVRTKLQSLLNQLDT
jgi:tetratricopeptide (TPR) repeat protein